MPFFSQPSILILQHIILVYFLWINAFYLMQLIVSWCVILRRQKIIEEKSLVYFLKSEGLPSVGFVVPAWNEAEHIVLMVETLLNIPYQEKRIIVVNDGSTDETMNYLRKSFHLTPVHGLYWEKIPTQPVTGFYQSMNHPQLVVIEKLNGGRADAINVGINASNTDFLLTTDADTLIDGIELSRMMRYMLTQPEIRAFGSTVRISNNCEAHLRGIVRVRYPDNWLAGIQVVEYIRAFLVGRQGWELFGGPFILSGAFSFYHTEDLQQLGGFDPKSFGEDMDMTCRFKAYMKENKKDARTGFVPEPMAWTEVPETVKSLVCQRERWQIGLLQVLWKMKRLFFNPRYGALGMVVYPFYFFGEALSPIVEFLGYGLIVTAFVLGISPTWILYFLLITWGFTTFLNVACLLLELVCFNKYEKWSDIGKLVFYSIIENFGFRQITIWARLRGTYLYFFGKYQWVHMERKGFKK